MRKLALVFIGLAPLALASAQGTTAPVNECVKGHYLQLDFGGGIHNLVYDLDGDADRKRGGGIMVRAGYRYFFNPNWGVGIGVNYKTLRARSILHYTQSDGVQYLDFREKNKQYMIGVPVGAYYQHELGSRMKLGAGLGFLLDFTAKERYKSTDGAISDNGAYIGRFEEDATPAGNWRGHYDTKTSAGLFADFNLGFAVTRRIDIIAGTYLNFGFNKYVDPKEGAPAYPVVAGSNTNAGVLNTQTNHTRPVAWGGNVGLRFRLSKDEAKAAPAPVQVEPAQPEFLPNRQGARVVLRNVKFDTGKSVIREESYPELDKLARIMTSRPHMRVEISGHTDNTGSAAVNDKISQERADAIVDYLVSKGVERDRLESKGYGSSQPCDTNDTAEGRQNNRRCEAKVIRISE